MKSPAKVLKRISWLIGLLFLLTPLTVFAQNKVVVIPLFGDDTPSVPAPLPRTGQTTPYRAGDDGTLKKGVAWPNPRFTKNKVKISGISVDDGTVTDNLTGLIWLKNANCFGNKIFEPAVATAYSFKSGSCGLLDGSKEGDWRLPNIRELHSLISFRYYNPALSNTAGTGQWTAGNPFNNVQLGTYWSSTTWSHSNGAFAVNMILGSVDMHDKDDQYYIWPVRSGQ